ncbi:FAD-dependent monooxygenase [Amycolatopsis anabasis]|uniref:FAD-dependent monooxygenase n=1 Tax=Amycolatopsis anabasis TaxID=1840409 RepID=UPI00131A9D17|nr:FAD-dependent monooxygenase [Amycolatopsis anabasis]
MTRALIIGGGIAGPVTAMALDKAGLGATVFEAYPTGADDVGAFLTIMPNGMDALRAIGADGPVIEASFPADTIERYDHTGAKLGERRAGGGRGGARTLKRATLYRVLHDEAARRGIPLHHGKRLTGARTAPGGRVTAEFADGSHAEADLLVGADGIHSTTTRALIDPAAPRPRYTGLNIVYGYTRSRDFPPATTAYRMIQGSRASFGYTTAPDGETFWFCRLPLPEVTRDELAAAQWRDRALEFFAADRSAARDVIAATGEDLVGSNGYDVPSTPAWHANRMVLTGDAAHAASPAAGQGASMALEDSVVLAQCLRDLPDLERAFGAYVARRRARVERLVAASAGQDAARVRHAASAAPRQSEPGDDREWLYGHHIDWHTPVTAA